MSVLEDTLAAQMRLCKLPEPVREHKFAAPERKWAFDFAWPDALVAVECEGGVYSGGRHTRGKGFEDDCVKYNRAAMDGWLVLRFTLSMIENGYALNMIERALKARLGGS